MIYLKQIIMHMFFSELTIMPEQYKDEKYYSGCWCE